MLVSIRHAAADDGTIKPSDLRVLEPNGNATIPPAREMLNRYLLVQARQQFDARRKAIAAIKTPEDIAKRQRIPADILPRARSATCPSGRR